MKHLFALVLSMLVCHAHAQQITPRSQAEAFLATIQQGKIANGYARLFEGSNIPRDRGAGATIRKQTETTLPLFGRVLGYELLREESFGPSLTRLVYVLKSERHLTAWEFYFYKPGNRWFVAEVNFSDKFNFLGAKK